MVVESTNPVVEKLSDLRSLDTTDALSVKVLGYENEFDGGGGYFIRESNSPSQVDNDGDIVVSAFNPAYYWKKWL